MVSALEVIKHALFSNYACVILTQVMMISSTLSASLIVGHALITKTLMTALFRLKITSASTPKAEVEKVKSSQFYQRVHSAQLNEAEYAPLLVGTLLFLSIKGVAAPIASTLSLVGQVGYYWLRAFVGHSHEGGMEPPPYAPFAIMRYVALGMIAVEIYGLA